MRLTDQERLLRLVTEKEWTASVVDMMRKTGWLVCHFRTAVNVNGRWMTPIQGHEGFPDVTAVKPPRMIVAELKRQHGGVTSPAQTRWLDSFRGVPGVEVYEWRPGDVDVVWAVLNGIRLSLEQPPYPYSPPRR